MKICKKCKNYFLPSNNAQKYCFDCGYSKKEVKIKVKECKHCKKEFIPKTNNQLYCTKKCRITSPEYKQKQKDNFAFKGRIYKGIKDVTKNCERCGKEFKTTEGRAKIRKYCSNICRVLASRDLATHNKNEKKRKLIIELEATNGDLSKLKYKKKKWTKEEFKKLEKLIKRNASITEKVIKLRRSVNSITYATSKLKGYYALRKINKNKNKSDYNSLKSGINSWEEF